MVGMLVFLIVRLVVMVWLSFFSSSFFCVSCWMVWFRLIFGIDWVEFLLMLCFMLIIIEGRLVVFFMCVVMMFMILGC